MRATVLIGGSRWGQGLDAKAGKAISAAVDLWALEQQANHLRSFREQGHERRGGPSWADLTTKYQQRKLRLGYSGMPLIKTGALRNSQAHKVERLGPFRWRVRFGAMPDYGKYHQEGKGRMYRPYAFVTESDMERLRTGISTQLARSFGRG